MHLRQAHNRHTHTALGYCPSHSFWLAGNRRIALRRIAFYAHMARFAARKPRAGGRDQQFARFEHRPQSLNRVALVLPALGKLRHIVVIERQVHHRIHACRSAAQALQILKIAAMHLGARSLQLLCTGVAPCQAAHLMACGDEFLHQCGSDKTCRSRYKNTHATVSLTVCRLG
jgi:hypothetical protein